MKSHIWVEGLTFHIASKIFYLTMIRYIPILQYSWIFLWHTWLIYVCITEQTNLYVSKAHQYIWYNETCIGMYCKQLTVIQLEKTWESKKKLYDRMQRSLEKTNMTFSDKLGRRRQPLPNLFGMVVQSLQTLLAIVPSALPLLPGKKKKTEKRKEKTKIKPI